VPASALVDFFVTHFTYAKTPLQAGRRRTGRCAAQRALVVDEDVIGSVGTRGTSSSS
jgi:hypothetical protein